MPGVLRLYLHDIYDNKVIYEQTVPFLWEMLLHIDVNPIHVNRYYV